MSPFATMPLLPELTADELRSVLKSLPGYVFTTDREQRVTSTNHVGAGLTEAQVLGMPVLAFIPAEFQEIARRAYDDTLQTGAPTSFETLGPSMEAMDQLEWYAIDVRPLFRDGQITGLLSVSRDISDRKRFEAELHASIERLEEKNRLLVAENAERERAEAALRAQQDAVLSMSTPIIQAWEGVLALPIVGSLDQARGAHMMERLLAEIIRTQSRFAVLDLTGVDGVDTSTVSHLLDIVRATSLLGSRCLVSGISPAIAQTMVALGGAEALMTFGQMQDALGYALSESGVRPTASPMRRA